MENIIIKLLDQTKMKFDAEVIIRIAIALVLAVGAFIALAIIQRRIKARLIANRDLKRVQACTTAFRVARVVVVIVALIAILSAVGITFAGPSIIFAALTVIAVLVIKDAMQDFFAGFMIMSDKYYNVGDAVCYDGRDGIVVSFTARTTKIEFLDDRSVMSVANRNISQITKLTHLVDIDLPLPYELSGRKAFELLGGICESIRRIKGVESCELKGTQSFDESAIIYKIRFFCEPNDRPDIRRAVLKTIQDGLEDAGVRIPYRQIDVNQKTALQ